MAPPPNRFSVDLTGVTLLGVFRVEGKIAAGGMGSVYRATNVTLEKAVVVKVPDPALLGRDGFRERFDLEIRQLVKFNHPNVVSILAAGEHEGVPFFVLDYLEGGSLKDQLARAGGRQVANEVLAWLKPIAAALDVLHANDVIHRDVKPGNILFHKFGQPYLSDFGIAKVLSGGAGGLTATGSALFTPSYAAPEQMRDDTGSGPLDGAADQYALASTVYEALGGRPPFQGSTSEIAAGKLRDAVPDLRQVAGHVPASACTAVSKALSRRAQDRFPTCSAFAAAFEAGLAPAAEAAPTVHRTRRVATRDPAVAGEPRRRGRALPVLTLLALLGGGGFLGLQALGMLGGGRGGDSKETARGPVAPAAPAPPPSTPTNPPEAPASPPESPPTPPPPAPSLPTWAAALLSQAQKDDAQRLQVPAAFEEPTTGMRFVLIPGDSFPMGSPESEPDRSSDEDPQHRVTVPAFYLSIHETTNAQYRRFKPDHRGNFDGDTGPVETVSHEEARDFSAWLSEQGTGGTRGGYRLPNEAEWEYACRAGTPTRFASGDTEADLARVGWYEANAASTTHPVGEKPANPWGVFDIHGNVGEWCADDYHPSYTGAPSDGRAWIDTPRGRFRVYRGGSWRDSLSNARSADRNRSVPNGLIGYVGFRLARTVTAGAPATGGEPAASAAPGSVRPPDATAGLSVPDVVGRQPAEAVEAVLRAGLMPIVELDRVSLMPPAGEAVTHQQPAAAATVRAGDLVRLRIPAAPIPTGESVTVPVVTGLLLAAAEQQIAAQGRVTRVFTLDVPSHPYSGTGRVVAQYPVSTVNTSRRDVSLWIVR